MTRFSPGLIYPSSAVANQMISTFLGSQAANANASPQTFSNGGGGFDAGANDPNCWIVVGLFYGSAGLRLSTGVTFGGVALTMAVRAATIASRVCELWYGNFTAGGTGNVVATYGNTNNGAVGVWKIIGPLSTANIQTATDANTSSSNPSLALSKPNAAGMSVCCTASGNTVTFTDPPVDFATNETTTTTYRFNGGHDSNIPGPNWQPSLSVAASPGTTQYAHALFPPT